MRMMTGRRWAIRHGCDRRLGDPRRGYTLVELLVVIGLTSVVFTTVAVSLHLLQRLNHQLTKEIPQSDAMMRLTMRFRADAHGSTEFSTESNRAGGLAGRFTQPDGVTIRYELQSATVARIVERNKQLVHHERFRCAEKTELEWMTQDAPSVVTLLLKKDRGRLPQGTDSIEISRVDAALGLGVRGQQ